MYIILVMLVCYAFQLSQAVGDFGAACEGLLLKYRKHIIRKKGGKVALSALL